MNRRPNAFTLIELLVVISIIALLIAILLPALGAARKTAQDSQCRSNLKQVATAFYSYEVDHKDRGHDRINYGNWTEADGITWRDADDPLGYWGIAYAVQGNMPAEAFTCPNAMGMDDDPGWASFTRDGYATYGFNGVTKAGAFGLGVESALFEDDGTGSYSRARSSGTLEHPSSTPLAQDAFEHMLDSTADTLPTSYIQWGQPHQQTEYYRHQGRTCNVSYVDAHVSSEREGQEELTIDHYVDTVN